MSDRSQAIRLSWSDCIIMKRKLFKLWLFRCKRVKGKWQKEQ